MLFRSLTFLVGAIVTAVVTLLVLAVARGVLGAQEAAVIITWTVAILVSYGAAALAATVEAVIFRRLLAWREGSTLPALLPS